MAALLDDLAQRGMLEDTLVLFGSEFGRLPKLKVLMDATTTLLVTDVAGRGGVESRLLLRLRPMNMDAKPLKDACTPMICTPRYWP